MKFGAKTDIGRLREKNEDSYSIVFGHSDIPVAFIIADGMGGHNSGEVASKTAVDFIANYITNNPEIFADETTVTASIKEVIEKAKSLLKEGGKILFSVPNVAHNGVIAQLINNNFKYTETGILDYTHVKFYTYYSFHELMEQCGMVIYSEKAIYQDTKLGGWHDFDILDEK